MCGKMLPAALKAPSLTSLSPHNILYSADLLRPYLCAVLKYMFCMFYVPLNTFANKYNLNSIWICDFTLVTTAAHIAQTQEHVLRSHVDFPCHKTVVATVWSATH